MAQPQDDGVKARASRTVTQSKTTSSSTGASTGVSSSGMTSTTSFTQERDISPSEAARLDAHYTAKFEETRRLMEAENKSQAVRGGLIALFFLLFMGFGGYYVVSTLAERKEAGADMGGSIWIPLGPVWVGYGPEGVQWNWVFGANV